MNTIVNVFKSLSDKTRIRIIHLLLKTGRELCICEIMDSLRLAQYNISKHIRELKIAGLVKERREGRFVFYSAIPQKDQFLKQAVISIISIPEKYFLSDKKRLKKRLCLRKNGKITVGMVKRKC
ncbi:MAG: winged helix-turn-helix transcriptional regulator [Elusimicrobia bacterium]|nr:winged helix-turn-helix transcriptional regulator [Elusimicrobiota bacterium]